MIGAGEVEFGPTGDGRIAGSMFETMVINEVYKQAGWSERTVDIAHYRDRNGAEVDLIIEDRRTTLAAGVEIKLTATSTDRHARHLAMLRDRLGARFTVGLVMHAGQQRLPLGERLWAVPVSTLWRDDATGG